MFLCFANFYKRFIKNFSRIAVLLTSILWTINKLTKNEVQSIEAGNQISSSTASGVNKDRVGESIENLSTIVNLAKFKKSTLLEPKKSNLSNIKANFGTNFLISKTNKTFIYLQKTYIKSLILSHFYTKCFIWIKINTLEYIIHRVLS